MLDCVGSTEADLLLEAQALGRLTAALGAPASGLMVIGATARNILSVGLFGLCPNEVPAMSTSRSPSRRGPPTSEPRRRCGAGRVCTPSPSTSTACTCRSMSSPTAVSKRSTARSTYPMTTGSMSSDSVRPSPPPRPRGCCPRRDRGPPRSRSPRSTRRRHAAIGHPASSPPRRTRQRFRCGSRLLTTRPESTIVTPFGPLAPRTPHHQRPAANAARVVTGQRPAARRLCAGLRIKRLGVRIPSGAQHISSVNSL